MTQNSTFPLLPLGGIDGNASFFASSRVLVELTYQKVGQL